MHAGPRIERTAKKAEKVSSLIFDQEELLARVENDRELIRDLLAIFKEEFPRQLLALREAVEAGDGDRVATAADTLRACSPISQLLRRPLQPLGSSRWAARKRFWVFKKPSVHSKRCQSAPAAIGRLPGRGVQVKILIADDEVMSRRLLQSTLERAGYEVLAVENGRQAAERICTADGPRLALLDWVMPELDGPGVCREVRKQKEQSYVYMVLIYIEGSKRRRRCGLGVWGR
jgi:CheY-like chemotaxis protein